jgi:hypothetical protein
MTYHVEEPFLAVRDEPARPFVFVTITEGSIITIIGEVQQSGLVDVRYDRRNRHRIHAGHRSASGPG